MTTFTITVAASANCPGGLAAQTFQVLSRTWTGTEVPWGEITDFLFMADTWEVSGGGSLSSSRPWLAHPHPVVGWAGDPGAPAPVHVVRVVPLPNAPEMAASGLPELLLCYGGDAGVRLLDDTLPTVAGLPAGQGHPFLALPASAITALPAEVQTVVRQRLCAWCGEESGATVLCPRCAANQLAEIDSSRNQDMQSERPELQPRRREVYLSALLPPRNLPPHYLVGLPHSTMDFAEGLSSLDAEMRAALRVCLWRADPQEPYIQNVLPPLVARVIQGDEEARAELLRLAAVVRPPTPESPVAPEEVQVELRRLVAEGEQTRAAATGAGERPGSEQSLFRIICEESDYRPLPDENRAWDHQSGLPADPVAAAVAAAQHTAAMLRPGAQFALWVAAAQEPTVRAALEAAGFTVTPMAAGADGPSCPEDFAATVEASGLLLQQRRPFKSRWLLVPPAELDDESPGFASVPYQDLARGGVYVLGPLDLDRAAQNALQQVLRVLLTTAATDTIELMLRPLLLRVLAGDDVARTKLLQLGDEAAAPDVCASKLLATLGITSLLLTMKEFLGQPGRSPATHSRSITSLLLAMEEFLGGAEEGGPHSAGESKRRPA